LGIALLLRQTSHLVFAVHIHRRHWHQHQHQQTAADNSATTNFSSSKSGKFS
jgi:hypothetical protein